MTGGDFFRGDTLADKIARQYVRNQLKNIDQIEREIKLYKEAILNPWRESDENFGGGRSNKFYSQPESVTLAKLNNKQLNQRIAFVNTYKSAIEIIKERNQGNEKVEEIIRMRHIKNWSWQKISMEIHYEERQCRRLEVSVVDMIAEKMGL